MAVKSPCTCSFRLNTLLSYPTFASLITGESATGPIRRASRGGSEPCARTGPGAMSSVTTASVTGRMALKDIVTRALFGFRAGVQLRSQSQVLRYQRSGRSDEVCGHSRFPWAYLPGRHRVAPDGVQRRGNADGTEFSGCGWRDVPGSSRELGDDPPQRPEDFGRVPKFRNALEFPQLRTELTRRTSAPRR